MKNSQQIDRESNYDLLRIVACIAVIVIHASSLFYDRVQMMLAQHCPVQMQTIAIVMVSRCAIAEKVMR